MLRRLAIALCVLVAAGACSESNSSGRSASTTTPRSIAAEVHRNGVEIVDLTWISETRGWALASAGGCSAPDCTKLLTTTDGGESWSSVPAERPVRDVKRLRFANATVGYVFDPSLMMTTDGGRTWVPQPGRNVAALETDGHNVIRLSYRDTGCPGPCDWWVERAAVGSSDWRRLPAPSPTSQGASAQLVREGEHDVYAAFYGNPAGGGPAQASLIASNNGGDTWVARPDPCAVASRDEVDAVAIAAAPGGVIAALCVPRIAEDAKPSVVVSTDRAATFGRHQPVTTGPHSGVIAATSRDDLIVATASTGGGGKFRYQVEVSHDAGRTWKTAVVDVEDLSGLTTSEAFLGFQSGAVGRWVGYPRTIWTTKDGGDNWTAHRFD
jgi:hypothetical protein